MNGKLIFSIFLVQTCFGQVKHDLEGLKELKSLRLRKNVYFRDNKKRTKSGRICKSLL